MKSVNVFMLLSLAVVTTNAKAYYDPDVVHSNDISADGGKVSSADGGEVSKSLIKEEDYFLLKLIGPCHRFESLESCENRRRVLKEKLGSEPTVERCKRQAGSSSCDKPNPVHSNDISADGGEVSKSLIKAQDYNFSKSIGPCRGNYPSYYYNSTSEKCEYFIWSGCGDNNNRFESLESCENRRRVLKEKLGSEPTVERCKRQAGSSSCDKPNPEYDCVLALVNFPCGGLSCKWYYDPKEGKCRQFECGSRNNNRNNYQTHRKCTQFCGEKYSCNRPRPAIHSKD